jgi:hypothetical protein
MTTTLQPTTQPADQLRSRRDVEDVDTIRCRECGTAYPAIDGPGMLYSLKAPCLNCGGECELTVEV